MSWDNVYGHQVQRDRLRTAAANNRLPNTMLFVGPDGIGKRTFAMEFAKALFCNKNADALLAACDNCADCIQFDAGNHPDLILVSKPKDKNQLSIDLFVGDDDHRMQTGMVHDIGLKPFRGKRKIAIIDDADFLNQESANCLLKTLEEPPPGAIIILVGTGEQRQLPTIRSRSQSVRFRSLSNELVEKILIENHLVDDASIAKDAAAVSDGSVQKALMLADTDVRAFRQQWLGQLSSLDPGKDDFGKSLVTFIEEVGSDNAVKRTRFQWVVDCAVEFFEKLLATHEGAEVHGDTIMLEAVEVAQASNNLSSEHLCDCIEICFETQRHISANAHIATLVPHFLQQVSCIGV